MRSPFDKEYVTILLPDGEEFIIPRSLLSKSPKINQLIHHSYDNSISIHSVASSAFSDLVHLLLGDPPPLEADRLSSMLLAAQELEITEEINFYLSKSPNKEEVDRLTRLFLQRQGGLPPPEAEKPHLDLEGQ